MNIIRREVCIKIYVGFILLTIIRWTDTVVHILSSDLNLTIDADFGFNLYWKNTGANGDTWILVDEVSLQSSQNKGKSNSKNGYIKYLRINEVK